VVVLDGLVRAGAGREVPCPVPGVRCVSGAPDVLCAGGCAPRERNPGESHAVTSAMEASSVISEGSFVMLFMGRNP
jgi:hypothetical protein